MPSRRLHRLLTSTLGVAVALGSVPLVFASAADAGNASPTRVGTVAFDRVHEALVIPVEGAQPAVSLKKLAPRQYVADLANSVLARSELQGQRLHSAELTGWSLDEAPEGHTVRLRLTLNEDVQPSIQLSREANNLRVEFDGALAKQNIGLPMAHVPTAKTAPLAAAKPTPHFGFSLPHLGVSHYAHRAVTWVQAFLDHLPATPVQTAVAKNPVRPVAKAAAKPVARPAKGTEPKPVAVAARPVVKPASKPAVQVAVKPVVNVHPVAHSAKPALQPVVHVASQPVIKPSHATVAHVQVAALPHAAHSEAVAQLGVPHYDGARNLLVVPVAGHLDPHRLNVTQLNPRWAYLDLPNSRPTFSGVRFQNRQDALFQRWVMAKRPGRDTTRVSFALGSPADIDVKLEGKQLLVAVHTKTMLLGKLPALNLPVPHLPVVQTAQAAPTPAAAKVAAKPVVKPVVAPLARVVPVAKAKPMLRLEPLVLAQAPVKLAPTTKHVRRPFFDEGRYGLVIPFEGQTPLYRWNKQGDRQCVVDLKGDVKTTGEMMQRFRRHNVMAAWHITRRSAEIIRVEMSFNRDAELVLAADPAHKQMLLIPQPRLAGDDQVAKSPLAVARTTLSAVERDLTSQEIYIPFRGPAPAYTIEQVTPTFAYVNFNESQLQPEGVHFFAPDYNPSLNYWLFSERPQVPAVRLALALTQPGSARVYEDKLLHRLVVVVGGEAPQALLQKGRTSLIFPEPWPGHQRPSAYRPVVPTVYLPNAS